MPVTQSIEIFTTDNTGGGTVMGTGVAGQVAVWSAANTIGGSNNLTFISNRLNIQGNQRWKRTATAISYALLATDFVISFTDLSVNRTATLPSIAVVGDGTVYILKKADTVGVGNLTLNPFAGNTIENVGSLPLAGIGESAIIIADADLLNWEVIG